MMHGLRGPARPLLHVEPTGPQEPSITINGVQLTVAQASTVRCAIAHWQTDLADPKYLAALGEIGPLYAARLSEISKIIHKTK